MMAFIILLTVFSILFLFIRYHANNPSNIYCVVAREWQTLIGAVFGLATAATVLSSSQHFENTKQERKRIENEIIYLSSVVDDLNIFKAHIELRESFFDGSNLLDNCKIYVDYAKNRDLPKLGVGINLAQIIPNVSARSYQLINYAQSLMDNDLMSSDFVKETDCEKDPNLSKIMQEQLDNKLTSIDSLIEMIKLNMEDLGAQK